MSPSLYSDHFLISWDSHAVDFLISSASKFSPLLCVPLPLPLAPASLLHLLNVTVFCLVTTVRLHYQNTKPLLSRAKRSHTAAFFSALFQARRCLSALRRQEPTSPKTFCWRNRENKTPLLARPLHPDYAWLLLRTICQFAAERFSRDSQFREDSADSLSLSRTHAGQWIVIPEPPTSGTPWPPGLLPRSPRVVACEIADGKPRLFTVPCRSFHSCSRVEARLISVDR